MKKFLTLLALLSTGLLQAQTFMTYTTADGLINNTTLCVDVDANNAVWFGTQEGISSFDGDTWTNYTDADGLVHNTVFAIMIDTNGDLWAGTDFGFSIYDWSDWTTYTTDDGLEDNRIKSFFEDSQGLIWMGHNDGASSFDGSDFTNYTMDDGLPFGGVNDISEAANGDIWMGTGLGGCYVFDGSTFTEINEDDGLISNSVRAITVDQSDNKWVATNEGITVFDSDNMFEVDHDDVFTLPEPHEINPIEDVKIDSQGRVWAGVYVDYLVTVGGVSLYNGGVWTDFDEDDGLAGPNVSQLAIDSEDIVWVATSTGVTRIGGVPIGIESEEMASLNIYPNPTEGMINVISPEANTQVRVLDILGHEVYTAVLNAGRTNIDLSAMAPGTYLVHANSQVQKVLVR
jgi:ligand-binding sensor domain-containing protein